MPNGVSKAELVNLPGSHYSDPVVNWGNTIGITDIEFFESSRLGQRYTNNAFIGDYNNGNLYFFELNGTRDGFVSDSMFDDWWGLNYKEDLGSIRFGTGFVAITDIETGPDGLLYVLDYGNGVRSPSRHSL